MSALKTWITVLFFAKKYTPAPDHASARRPPPGCPSLGIHGEDAQVLHQRRVHQQVARDLLRQLDLAEVHRDELQVDQALEEGVAARLEHFLEVAVAELQHDLAVAHLHHRQQRGQFRILQQ
jgi:hypothetical protein